MPIVQVNILKGRSDEVKRQVARGITRVMVECAGVAPGSVRVLIHEIEPAHWFVAGEAKPPSAAAPGAEAVAGAQCSPR